jgi:hypothetical protein
VPCAAATGARRDFRFRNGQCLNQIVYNGVNTVRIFDEALISQLVFPSSLLAFPLLGFPKTIHKTLQGRFCFLLQAPFLAAHFTRLLRLRVHSRLVQKQSRVRCPCRAQGTSLPGLLDFFLPPPGAPREWIPGGLAGEGAFISFCLCRRWKVVSNQTTAPHLAFLSAPSGPAFRRPEPACS